MPKKVLAIIGSPRKKGNTSDVVNEVLRGAQDAGAETKVYYLNEMNFRGCQSCFYCRKNEACCIKDDMQEIYQDIKAADAVVIGSPVYICQVSGQIKLMLDRFYPLTDFEHKPRFGIKKTLMVYCQAAPFGIIFVKYFRYTEKYLKPMGLDVVGRIVATKAFDLGLVAQNKGLMQKAYNEGRKLVLQERNLIKRLWAKLFGNK